MLLRERNVKMNNECCLARERARSTKRQRDVRQHFVAPTPVGAHPRRVALVALRRARNRSTAVFFLPSFFFWAYMGKRKRGGRSAETQYGCCFSAPLATFLFDTAGAKRKVTKRETPKFFRALRRATKATRLGWAPPGGGAAKCSRTVRSRLLLCFSALFFANFRFPLNPSTCGQGFSAGSPRQCGSRLCAHSRPDPRSSALRAKCDRILSHSVPCAHTPP